MALRSDDRMDRLAGRIRWFDRYRRALSLVVGGIVWSLLAYELAVVFGAEGPTAISLIIGLKFGALAWWLTEAMFAWTIAMWEVEHDKLEAARAMPVAILLPRK